MKIHSLCIIFMCITTFYAVEPSCALFGIFKIWIRLLPFCYLHKISLNMPDVN